MGGVRLLRQSLPLLLGVAAAPGVHAGRAAGAVRVDRGQGRRTRHPARDAGGGPRRGGGPSGPATPHRPQLLRPPLRTRPRPAGLAGTEAEPPGRTRTGRSPAVQTPAADHRIDQPDLQRPARPGTTRRTHPRRRHRPNPGADPGPHRRHLAQRQERPTDQTLTDPLRPLSRTRALGLNHLGRVALVQRPGRVALVQEMGAALVQHRSGPCPPDGQGKPSPSPIPVNSVRKSVRCRQGVIMTRAWRGLIEEYRDRLPVTATTPVITLLEGGTPLLPAYRLSALTGCEVHLKVEGANPTG